jgi:hypothetical protein
METCSARSTELSALQSGLGLHLLSVCLRSVAVLVLRAVGGAQNESDAGDRKVSKHYCEREEKRNEVLVLQLSGCRESGIPVREFTDCDDQLFIGTTVLTGGAFACDVNSSSKPLKGRRLQVAESPHRGEFCCVHTHLHHSFSPWLKLADTVNTVSCRGCLDSSGPVPH